MAAHKQQAGKKRNVKYGGDDDDNNGAAAAAAGTPTGTVETVVNPAAAVTGEPPVTGADESNGTVDVEPPVFNPISQNATVTNGTTCVQKLTEQPLTDGKYVQVLNGTHIFFNINSGKITDKDGVEFTLDGSATFYQVLPSTTQGGKRKSTKKPRKHAKKARKSAKKARKSRGSRKSRK